MRKASKQRKWQLRNAREGRCITCGRPAFTTGKAPYCKRHLLLNRIRMRRRRGTKPWRPGGPGRRPYALAVVVS